jgi:2-alkyl-3-oxoalkanoate reductase
VLAFAADGADVQVLLTGATGVIGARVVPLLVAEGHTVTAVGRSADKRALLEGMGAIPIRVDLFPSFRSFLKGHIGVFVGRPQQL